MKPRKHRWIFDTFRLKDTCVRWNQGFKYTTYKKSDRLFCQCSVGSKSQSKINSQQQKNSILIALIYIFIDREAGR